MCECVCISMCISVYVYNFNEFKGPERLRFSGGLHSKNHSSCREKVIKILQFFTESLTDKCISMHSKYLENSFLPTLIFLSEQLFHEPFLPIPIPTFLKFSLSFFLSPLLISQLLIM